MSKGFNDSQKQAIIHKDGPMLVLAGPGSGKTTVITHRVKYLIEQYSINPNNILVITFTKAAATEMKQRFDILTQGAYAPCTFGTFHSVFFYMLRAAYGYTVDNILTEDVKYKILHDIIRNLNLEYEDEEEYIANVVSEISYIKGDMISPENYYSTNCGEEVFRKIYYLYQQSLSKMKKLDFDDMLVYCYELLSQRPDICSKWQEKYRYILIDEFQDINKIQYEIVKLLATPRNNLFIVGDDDQSIYGFRGAKPEIMLNITNDFADIKQILLDINYRCSKEIVSGSLKVIGNNTKRYSKLIVNNNPSCEPIHIHYAKNQIEESNNIIRQIREYNEKGIAYKDMAVIYRLNTQPRCMVSKLMEYNLPFKMRDKIPNIYDHFVSKNIFDYINAALGNRERSLFLRILNKPNRYLKRDILSDSYVDFEELRKYVEGKNWAIDNLYKLEYDLKMLAKLKPYAAINFIRKAIGYDEYIKEYSEYRRMNEEDLYDVLDELMENAKNFENYEDWFNYIEEYKNKLLEQVKNNGRINNDGITVTTMHSAKGLEYDVVFIIEANEGIVPYKKAVKQSDIEEERRMFYVSMTRAKKHLHIYSLKHLYNKDLDASRFLLELLDD